MDAAVRTQSAPEFGAVGAMVGLAAMIGRGVAIRPKRRDDWTVVPNLWGAVIGRPGALKSPALDQMVKPIRNIEAAARTEYESAHSDWELEAAIVDSQGKAATGRAGKGKSDASAIRTELASLAPPIRVPTRPERRDRRKVGRDIGRQSPWRADDA
jgi:putative DNA primase/helicase